LHRRDASGEGFRWVIGDDRANSVFAFLRLGAEGDPPVLVVCNMTPAPRHHYRIGVPQPGYWREIANTDSRFYGGSDMGNDGGAATTADSAHGEPQSLDLTLPPLATIMLRAES
jgi:1,4-alpha-glucan branching enzyme